MAIIRNLITRLNRLTSRQSKPDSLDRLDVQAWRQSRSER